MNLQLGWVYNFVFNEGFEKLDGTYVLVKDSTYEEMLSDGHTLYNDLYFHVNKSQDELEIMLPAYRIDRILKLVSTSEVPTDIVQSSGVTVTVSTNREIYVPISVIKTVPIHNVNQYSKVVLAFNVGVYPGDHDLTYLKDSIYERLSAELGYSQTPDIITIDKVWLTDDEYNTIKTSREDNITKITNHYSEIQRLNKEIVKLNATIASYEQLVKTWEGI